ncbi:MAG: hypothetical protein ACJ73E_10610, partial [Mycobacteriales bacterium]
MTADRAGPAATGGNTAPGNTAPGNTAPDRTAPDRTPAPPGATRRLRLAMVVVGLLAVLAAGLGAGVPSTYGGHAAVDEPQYLLSALSLWEDHDLDIA